MLRVLHGCAQVLAFQRGGARSPEPAEEEMPPPMPAPPPRPSMPHEYPSSPPLTEPYTPAKPFLDRPDVRALACACVRACVRAREIVRFRELRR